LSLPISYSIEMLDNHVYDLMTQLVQESQSLWRIKREYIANASHCEECKNFWEKMVMDKEEHIEELENILADHLNE